MSSIFPFNKVSLHRLCLMSGRNLALACGLLAGPAAWAQAPTWQSAYLAGGGAYSQVMSIATDASGNVYIAGFFGNRTFRLGDIVLTNAVTDSRNEGFNRDAFIAKWSPVTKSFVWAQRIGGDTSQDEAAAVTVSGTSVYVVARLGGATFNGTTLAEGSYLVKFSDAGTPQWVQPTGMYASSLAVNGSSVYVAGNFTGTTNIGDFRLTSYPSNASTSTSDLVVAKLTDAGTSSRYVWAQQAGGPGYDGAGAIAVQGSDVYVTAGYEEYANFGSVYMTNRGSGVVKLVDAGSSGSFSWVRPIPVASVSKLAVGNGGRLYVTGVFAETATFGNTTLTGLAGANSFIVSLTDEGNGASWGWAQQVSHPDGYTNIQSIVAAGNSVYIAGQQGRMTNLGNTTLPIPNGAGAYVAKLADMGSTSTYSWAMSADALFMIPFCTLGLSGTNVYLGGMVSGPVSFGSITQPAAGGPVAFLSQLSDGATALAAAASTSPTELGVTPNPAHAATTVQLPPGAAKGEATLTLLDAQGRAVRTQVVRAAASATLDLAGVTPGLYLVRVKAGETQTVRRLAVE